MQKMQGNYSVLADRMVWRSFLFVYALFLATVLFGAYQEGPDDAMRWVMVQDLLAGQGWFDAYQHRLGPGGGTLMHWSRLVDAPIAGIYALSAIVVPPDSALQVTAFVWPVLLAGLTLWTFAVTGGALGGRNGAISALVVGVLTLEHYRKFDYFSFDHHNVQILLFAAALMFFVLRKAKPSAAGWLGVCLALSVSIGTESIVQVAIIAVFLTIDWIVTGAAARRRTMVFGTGLALTLFLVSVATTGRQGFLFPSCDALTISVALPAGIAALCLCAAAWVGSGWSHWGRFGACLAIGAVTLGCAYAFAPYCLENPIANLPQDMRDFWLSQVAEAQNITVVLELHLGEAAALIAMSVITAVAALFFVRQSQDKMDYLLFLALIVTGFSMFLYQSRMMTFLGVSLVAVQAQMLRALYISYRTHGRTLSGLAMVGFVVCVSPKIGISVEKQLGRFARPSLAAPAAEVARVSQNDGAACKAPQAYAALKNLPAGMVLVDFDFAAEVLRYTNHSVLAGNYHRNRAGIQAQIAVLRMDASQAGPRLAALGVSYVLICTATPRTEFWDWASQGRGLQSQLAKGETPAYLSRIDGGEGAAFQVFQLAADF
ncbi:MULTISPECIES: hypothetical protein [unclassified Ruegeria]|uniref:hypothetical protein n=1 Tax=unclassified Ruegeria TaxID=2625375 RepID=UPI001AE3E182|nr:MULTISPECIES: hypothetical protein [unclassified Ruegeria]